MEPGGACGQLGNPSCPQIHRAVLFAEEDCKMGVGIEPQQLGLEIVLPRCVGAEKDVALAALGQSDVFLRGDGLVNLQATYDKIGLF